MNETRECGCPVHRSHPTGTPMRKRVPVPCLYTPCAQFAELEEQGLRTRTEAG